MRRREFLTVSAASAAMAAAGNGSKAAQVLRTTPAEGFSRAQFRSWLDEDFGVTHAGSLRRSRATLIAVDDGPTHGRLEQFSVVFRGSTPMPRGLCWISPPGGAQFMLHLHGTPGTSLRRAHFSLLEARHG